MPNTKNTTDTHVPPHCFCDEKVVTYYARPLHAKSSWILAAFLALWVVVWTFGCVSLATAESPPPALHRYCFYLFDVLAVFLLLRVILCYERGTLNCAGFQKEVGLGPFFRRTLFVPMDEILFFRLKIVPSDGENGEWRQIELLCEQRVVVLLDSFSSLNDAQDWFLDASNRFLKQNGFLGGETKNTPNADAPCALGEERDVYSEQDCRLSVDYPASAFCPEYPKPAKTRWRKEGEYAPIVFSRRERFSWRILFDIPFAAVWNGTLWLFVPQILEQPLGWFHLFMLPFFLVGGYCIWECLRGAFAPLSVERWSFEMGRIKCEKAFLGFSRSREFDLLRVRSFRIRRGAKLSSGTQNEAIYQLLFLDAEENELCEITNLTWDEAHWLMYEYREVAGFCAYNL